MIEAKITVTDKGPEHGCTANFTPINEQDVTPKEMQCMSLISEAFRMVVLGLVKTAGRGHFIEREIKPPTSDET